MRDDVKRLWPELEWIADADLRGRVARTWEMALDASPLAAADLERIPFTLLVPDCPVSFMAHKRCVVHIARRSAQAMAEFFGAALPIDLDTVVAGAILADVGKLSSTSCATAAPSSPSGVATCATRSPASAWRWRAACPTPSVT